MNFYDAEDMSVEKRTRGLRNAYNNLALPIKASFWYLFCSVLQKAIGFLTTPLFTRVMDTNDFGTVTMYNSWETVFTVLCTLYLYNGVYNNAMVEHKDDRDGFTSSVQSLTTVLTIIVFSIYFVFSSKFAIIVGLPNSVMALMMVDIIFTAGMSFWSIRNRYEYKYKSVAIFTILSTILMPIISVTLVLNSNSQKAYARILGTVIVHITVYSIVYILNLKRGKKLYDAYYWKYAVRFNLPLIPHYLSSTIMTQSDRVVINNICGTSYAAIYSMASNVTSIMNIVTVSINQAVTPWIYEMLEKKKMKEIGYTTYKIMSIVGMGFVLTSFIAPELVAILAPSEYNEAVWATPPLLVGMFLYFMYCNFGNIEIYFHKQKVMLFSSTIVAIINLVLDYFLVKAYGFIAASYATMASYFIYTMLHFLFMSKVCIEKKEENPYRFNTIIGMIVIFSGLIMISSLLYEHIFARYVIVAAFLIFCIIGVSKNKEVLLSFLKKR